MELVSYLLGLIFSVEDILLCNRIEKQLYT